MLDDAKSGGGSSPPSAAAGATPGRLRDRLALIACVALYGALSVPGVFLVAGPGLDISWIQVFNRAYQRGWQYGTDVIVPYGPWNVLVIPLLAPSTFWLMIAFRVALGACMGWAVFTIARTARAPSWLAPLVVLMVVPFLDAPATIDPMCLIVPFVWLALGLFFRDDHDAPVTFAFSALVGVIGLIKFTYFVLGVAVALLLAVDDVFLRRRAPRHAAIFVAVVFVGWLLAGQSPANFPAWIATNLEGAGAYDAAMSTPFAPGDALEIAGFCVVAVSSLVVAGLVFVSQRRGVARGALPWLGFALVLFMNLKAGFVRHDVHAANATFVLPAIAFTVWALCAESWPRRRALGTGIALVGAALACSAYTAGRWMGAPSLAAYLTRFYAGAGGSLSSLIHPASLQEQIAAIQEQAMATLRAAVPLPDLRGTVDLYSYNQAVVLAHDEADYRPRPIFQSYLAFSDALARRNAASLDRGPDHLLIDAATTDSRYPSSDDGRSWPKILSAYDFAGLAGPFAHFVRAPQARGSTFEPQGETAVRCGESLALPAHEGMLWAEIELDKTFLGALLGFALKTPPVRAHVRLASGAQADYRIIPSVARGGLLLTPLVQNATDFERLAIGQAFPRSQEVVSLTFECQASFEPTIRVRFNRLKIA